MKPVLVLLLVLNLACAPPSSNGLPDGYETAAPAYLVLTQKALSYQADFDTEAWGQMLTDSVEFITPDGQVVWHGKPAVLAGWQQWRKQVGAERMYLTDLTSLPIQITEPVPLWEKTGVYVVSYCTAHLMLRNGRQTDLLLNLCCHFDASGHIDRYLFLHQQPASDLITRKPVPVLKTAFHF
ncbi:hypothetical protein [Larkinella rosea]|uniref:Nuclear transport factor 2 family protein n=1 Tax=Larkinella rosea TaxID=2025312 RepID=A0A3P1C2S3_9BACT|nr:hypothetical protein [Larkinella rosea]RRB07607.1 hypothetical protein EHT25_07455 [Larkinella rosea]